MLLRLWRRRSSTRNEISLEQGRGRPVPPKGAHTRIRFHFTDASELSWTSTAVIATVTVHDNEASRFRGTVTAEMRASAAVREGSRFGLICAVTRGLGLVHVQALHGLAGDLSDEVEVLIEVQHRQPGEFRSRSNDQIW